MLRWSIVLLIAVALSGQSTPGVDANEAETGHIEVFHRTPDRCLTPASQGCTPLNGLDRYWLPVQTGWHGYAFSTDVVGASGNYDLDVYFFDYNNVELDKNYANGIREPFGYIPPTAGYIIVIAHVGTAIDFDWYMDLTNYCPEC